MKVTGWFFALYFPTIVLILALTGLGWDKPVLFIVTIITTIVWTRWAAHVVADKESNV